MLLLKPCRQQLFKAVCNGLSAAKHTHSLTPPLAAYRPDYPNSAFPTACPVVLMVGFAVLICEMQTNIIRRHSKNTEYFVGIFL